MIRIIDLDLLGKFLPAENGVVFAVTVAGEKLALTSDEVAELVRAKLASTAGAAASAGRAGGKKAGKGQSQAQGQSRLLGGDGSQADGGEGDGDSAQAAAPEGATLAGEAAEPRESLS